MLENYELSAQQHAVASAVAPVQILSGQTPAFLLMLSREVGGTEKQETVSDGVVITSDENETNWKNNCNQQAKRLQRFISTIKSVLQHENP